MKSKLLGIVVGLALITGCSEKDSDDLITVSKIDISRLNQQRVVTKNMIDFRDDNQGKENLLMMMINSVDYYNLISGKMEVVSSYLDNQTHIKYEFQVNIPEYKSYVYQISSENNEQCLFRDSEKMYFFTGKKEDLDNFSFKKLIAKKQITIEEISKSNNLFKFGDWSLKERADDIDITRVANDLYGDVAPYLFPEDIGLRQLGVDFNTFSIRGKDNYLNRSVFLIEGKINNDLYTEGGKISISVDQETGIILKYTRSSTSSFVEMKMENIFIDKENEVDMYNKYIDF